jgi:hypothetical protein
VPSNSRTSRQRFWERLWASSILIYTFVATFVVWKALKKYGVNPLAFFIVDAVTSWTYGIATARLVMRIIRKDWIASRKWAVAAAVSFITPQIYILVSARNAPRDVYLIVIGVISALAIFAITSLYFEIRKGRGVNPTF